MPPTRSLDELGEMKQALEEGRCPVRFFAEQDFLNGFFKAGRRRGAEVQLLGIRPAHQ